MILKYKTIDTDNFILVAPFVYEWEKNGLQYRISIPPGFVFDGASTPKWWWFKKLTGLWPDKKQIIRGALVHDWIYSWSRRSSGDRSFLPEGSYQYCSNKIWVNMIAGWSRDKADRIFFRICRQDGLKRSRTAWYGVRAFGWLSWG